MSKDGLKALIDSIEPLAVQIAEREPHGPILLVPGHQPVAVTTQSKNRAAVGLALQRAIDAMGPAEYGLFINEAYSTRDDIPDAVLARVLGPKQTGEGGVSIAEIDPQYRMELLCMYAEDAEGNWHYRAFEIRARTPGGLVRQHDMSGDPDSQTRMGGAQRGFVARRWRHAAPKLDFEIRGEE